jgi:hypothetical protein
MAQYHIVEEVSYLVEANDPAGALVKFLDHVASFTDSEKAADAGVVFMNIEERTLFLPDGRALDAGDVELVKRAMAEELDEEGKAPC